MESQYRLPMDFRTPPHFDPTNQKIIIYIYTFSMDLDAGPLFLFAICYSLQSRFITESGADYKSQYQLPTDFIPRSSFNITNKINTKLNGTTSQIKPHRNNGFRSFRGSTMVMELICLTHLSVTNRCQWLR